MGDLCGIFFKEDDLDTVGGGIFWDGNGSVDKAVYSYVFVFLYMDSGTGVWYSSTYYIFIVSVLYW